MVHLIFYLCSNRTEPNGINKIATAYERKTVNNRRKENKKIQCFNK